MAKKKYYRLDGTIEDTDQDKDNRTLEAINKELQLKQPTLATAVKGENPLSSSDSSFAGNVLNKSAYIGKKLGAGALRFGTGFVNNILQDTQEDLETGAKRDVNWYTDPKNIALTTADTVLNPLLTRPFKQGYKELFDEEYKKKGLVQKAIDNAHDIYTDFFPTGLKETVKNAGALDKQYLGGTAPKKVEDLSNTISKPSEDFDESLEKEGEKYSPLIQTAGKWADIIGFQAPNAVISAATGDRSLGLASMGYAAKGTGTREALKEGKTLEESIDKGTAQGGVEVITELLSGGLKLFGESIYGPGVLDNVVKETINKTVKKPMLNFLLKEGYAVGGEVVEEWLSDIANLIMDFGTNTPKEERTIGNFGKQIENYFKKQFGETTIDTIATTLIMNALGMNYTKENYNRNISEMAEYNNAIREKNGTNAAVKKMNDTLKQQNTQYEKKADIVQEVIEDANLDNGKDNLYMPEIIESHPVGENFETQTNQNIQTDNVQNNNVQNEQIETNRTQSDLIKERQLEIIKQFNPENSIINNVEDIKTYKETLSNASFTDDFTKADMKKALKSGEVTIYSFKPIKEGVFVTPSKSEAKNYAGKNKIYSKTVQISDVAWANNLEGEYAKIPNEIRTYNQNEDVQTEKSKILTEMPKQEETFSEKLNKKIKKAKYDFVDHLAPFYDLSRETKNPTLYHYADRIQSAEALSQNQIGKRQSDMNGKAYTNFIDENGNKVSMSFEKAYDLYNEIPVDAKNSYLVNNRNIEQLEQGVNQFDISYEDSVNTIKELKKDYKNIDKWAKNIWQYGYNELNWLVDSGLMSEEYAKELKKNNPHYVRIQRNIDSQNGSMKSKGKNIKVSNQIQQVKGSTLEILPIKETVAKYTQQITRSALINQLGQEYARTVGIDSQGNNISDIQEMFGIDTKVLNKTEDGYTFTIYDNGKPVTIPINEDIYKALQSRDIRTIDGLHDVSKGVRELITGKNPYFALSNAVRDFSDMMLYSKFPAYKSLSTYTKLFTGRTINKNGKIFGATPAELVEFYENTGNLSNTYFTNNEFESSKENKQKTGIKKVVDTVTKPITKTVDFVTSPIEKANNFIESMPRITEFWNTIDANGYMLQNGELVAKPGVTPTKTVQQTIAEASYNAAEITVNFKRGGTWAKNLDRNGATFFSAAVQGADKFNRTFKEAYIDAKNGDFTAAKRLFARAMTLGVAPAILGGIMYRDDKDYEELSDYVKDRYYVFKIPAQFAETASKTVKSFENATGLNTSKFPIVGDFMDNTKNIKNTDKFIRIPKGRAVSIFDSAARRTGEVLKGNNRAFDGYAELVLDQIAPNNPIESNVLSPLASVVANKSWSGNKIVSDFLNENFEENEQYDAKTSSISKNIAKGIKNIEDFTHIKDIPLVNSLADNDFINKFKSPKNIDYLIDQYSGVIGDILLPSTTNYAESEKSSGIDALLNPLRSKFSSSSVLNNQVYNEYKKMVDKAKRAGGSNGTNLQKAVKSYLTSDYSNVPSDLSALYSKQRDIQDDTTLSNSEKYKQNKEVQNEINEYLKGVINDVKNATEEDGVVTIGNSVYAPAISKKTGKEYMKNTLTLDDDDLPPIEETGISAQEYAKIKNVIGAFETDKDENGNSINGTKKKKAINYLEEEGYNYEQIKAIAAANNWKY